MITWLDVDFRLYLAQGGELYLTLGNFRSDPNTTLAPDCGGTFSYYYVEDVSVIAISNDEIPSN
ncbi:MAG: hypothetical protein IPP25_03240 [Saprospiraceae bacterium]|nr:hypothetical protein [Candidatus Opimibacter skivensis]